MRWKPNASQQDIRECGAVNACDDPGYDRSVCKGAIWLLYSASPLMNEMGYLRGGVRLLNKSDLTAWASFIGSPTNVTPFTVSMPPDRTRG